MPRSLQMGIEVCADLIYRFDKSEPVPRFGFALNIRPNNKGFYSIFAVKSFGFAGADDGTRTRGLLITNQLLYHLSYVGCGQ